MSRAADPRLRSLLAVAPFLMGASIELLEPAEPDDWSARLRTPDGLVLEDDMWTVRVGGRLAVDYVQYDRRNERPSGMRADEARLTLDASAKSGVSARLAVDLIGLDTRYGLEEGWVSYEPFTELRFTAGLIPIALGVEHSIPESRLSFVGYAFPAYLGDRTDLGLRLDGELGEGIFSYDLSAAFGEGFDAGGERRDEPQLSAKATTYPLRWVDFSIGPESWEVPLVSGLFFNIGYGYNPRWKSDVDVQHPFRGKLYWTPRLRADSATFLALGYGADLGPIRFLHEFVRGSLFGLDTAMGEVDVESELHAWQGTASVMLTGEPYDSRPYRRRGKRPEFPRRPMDGAGEARGIGAVEIAVRYANGDIARELIDLGFAPQPGVSQEFRTFTAAANWYPTAYFRVKFEVVRTLADQDPTLFGGQGRDTSGLVRFELDL